MNFWHFKRLYSFKCLASSHCLTRQWALLAALHGFWKHCAHAHARARCARAAYSSRLCCRHYIVEYYWIGYMLNIRLRSRLVTWLCARGTQLLLGHLFLYDRRLRTLHSTGFCCRATVSLRSFVAGLSVDVIPLQDFRSGLVV